MSKKNNILEISIIIICFILMIFLILFTPMIHRFYNSGNLIINEIVSKNEYSYVSYDNKYYDYIEIYNGYDYDINLKGYTLSDNLNNEKEWVFPDVTINSNDYLIVFASGLDKYEDGELHTNFKLSNDGEVLVFANNESKILSKLYYLESNNDTSYGYNGLKYVYYYNPSPNKENSGKYQDDPINVNSNIIINEYMSNNINGYKSRDGYYSVIELYNNSNKDINLEGYHLSNDRDKKDLYTFPNVSIGANSYLVVYLSGLDKYEDLELHTNFILDSDILFLSDNNMLVLDYVNIIEMDPDVSYGRYDDGWYFYNKNSIGFDNSNKFINNSDMSKDIIINEVSSNAIEIKNLTDKDINLDGYIIRDKSNSSYRLSGIIDKNGYYVIYPSFSINNTTEELYLYYDNVLIDSFLVGKLINGVSSGLNNDLDKVYYRDISLGRENSKNEYLGYAKDVLFSIDGGYVDKGTEVSLYSSDGSVIYYTLDGSFPNSNSILYKDKIKINSNTVIKAIAYKDNYIESDVISRTFLVDSKHDLPVVSISSSNYDLFNSNNGLLGTYNIYSDEKKKISFEFYESDGLLGTSFIGSSKLTGMDSRAREQKSMAVYLNKIYGQNKVIYPFFNNSDTLIYSSFTLRNSGEDPYGIRIQDTVLTAALSDMMDIDLQGYRAVVVYLNGEYYGLYNMREKLNGDYIENKFNVDDYEYDLVKYTSATKGSVSDFNDLVNYIRYNDVTNSDVYNNIKNRLDIQEFINYMIVESYYANTDQGNIRYWKSNNGKWRFMVYDLDWSLWSTNYSFSYMVNYNTETPAVTYLYSLYEMGRKLYTNYEFRDLYLKSFSKYLKEVFNPDRMNNIISKQADDIRNEMSLHVNRWPNSYQSVSNWEYNVNNFKQKLNDRYYYVVNNLRREFNLSDGEYQEYFGGLNE